MLKGKYTIKKFKNGKVISETEHENLVVLNENSGLWIVLNQLLLGTPSLEITHARIGTDDTPPVLANDSLGSAVAYDFPWARKARNTDEEIEFEFFLTDADLPDGEYHEFGLFCGERMFCRSLIEPSHTKSENEDTQILYTLYYDIES